MLRLPALLLLSSLALAQNKQAPDIVRAAQSPFDLARFIDSHSEFDWVPLWKALGEKHAFTARCDSTTGCLTELITVLKPRQTILAVETPLDTVYFRYFGSESEGWRRAGLYFAPIKYSSELEEWLDLTEQDFIPVFSFTTQGHESRMGVRIGRDLTASAHPWINAGIETIDLILSVKYSGLDSDLGNANYTATYQRLPGHKEFVLLSVKPSLGAVAIPANAFEDFASMSEDVTDEQLLAYALPGLKEAAIGKNTEVKEWMREMLGHCKDTQAKQLLLKLLGQP